MLTVDTHCIAYERNKDKADKVIKVAEELYSKYIHDNSELKLYLLDDYYLGCHGLFNSHEENCISPNIIINFFIIKDYEWIMAHEFCHFLQFRRKDIKIEQVSGGHIIWKGKRFFMDDYDYTNSPWEVEANEFADKWKEEKL